MNAKAGLRKKRNFKNLALSVQEPSAAAGYVNGLGGPVSASGEPVSSGGNILVGGGPESIYPLEIGVEFRLDLREEDLVSIKSMGEGAGGAVMKVLHKPTQTIMAMKIIRAEATIRQQVLKELQILHECNSPYIVSFYGAFPKNNGIQMCLEFMDLRSFDTIYRKHGPIPINVIGRITTSVIQGLIYLYEDMRVMHRDIKPSNILLNSAGFIKICDFGISKEMINSIADTFVGTASYMSPERMKGSSYTVKSDVWSLGLTLMELALGKFPFRPEGEAMTIFEMLNYITTEELPTMSPDEFPKDFCDMIDSCLAKDPKDRPTPRELVSHPFVVACSNARVDIAKWAKSLQTEEEE
ncbi:MAP kinase kinase (MEK) [Dipsacomyces acuminosporus]|nr:MAP kinase kinase (MEK) [Dipsacomyces acuminosporus]